MPTDPAGPTGLLSVGQAAARIGVAPSTLRTWQRRYGLAPSNRSDGGHRRYTPADLWVLHRMHVLTLAGELPARAALHALREVRIRPARTGETDGHAAPEDQDGRGGGDTDRTSPSPLAPDRATRGRRGAGGRVLAVPGAGPRARGLARAAGRLDVETATELIEAGLLADGVVLTYDTLIRPVLAAAGEFWARTGTGVEVEHLFSEAAIEALRHHRRTLRPRVGPGPPVLLACAPGDHHVIPLHVLAAALAEQTVPTRILGPRVPPAALAAAVTRTGAAAVFVWAQVASTALASVVAALPVRRPAVRVMLGGPGWAASGEPRGGHFVTSVTEAVALLR